jgi:hypothetical protein
MTESKPPMSVTEGCSPHAVPQLALAWREFIQFCSDLRHGEIERLSIQDGLPVLAEITKKKVKFHGRSSRDSAT